MKKRLARHRALCLYPAPRMTYLPSGGCGRSSGVEHNLAKVGVEGSNPFARSKISKTINVLRDGRLGDLFAWVALDTTQTPPRVKRLLPHAGEIGRLTERMS